MPRADGTTILALFNHWLIQRAVRQFFAIVGVTTNDRVQWAAREAFWLAYLEDGAIDQAWFAFGRQAEMQARGAVKAGEYGRIEGSGADPSHSALILSIGDVRIAEWSHNGSCRFWSGNDTTAAAPYEKKYHAVILRAMKGGRGYEATFARIPHMNGWQHKFAAFIYQHTGRRHPRWGDGLNFRSRY